jgi:hypothetical protein
MSLTHRKLPPKSLEARRADAGQSTGARTQCGKPRVALSSLRHGSFARSPWRSTPAPDEDGRGPTVLLINTERKKRTW